jgi:type IV pilus assembly protein PilA
MIDWYYHDPHGGRVGPLSAEELRKRFRDRRIQRDTLVWHHDLREWQPLERMAQELGLDHVQPDVANPPPLPGASPGATPTHSSASMAARAASRSKYSRAPLQPKKTLSTSAIVGIVIAVLAIPGVLVLASVMQSGYRNYARRTGIPTLIGQGNVIQEIVAQYQQRTGHCPSNVTKGFDEMARRATRAPTIAALRFMTMPDATCGFEFTLRNLGPEANGKTVLFESFMDGNELAWDCTGGTLPERFRPLECRASYYAE